MIARPHKTLVHQSRFSDAERIVDEAHQLEAELILVGLALDQEGKIGPQARKALRLVDMIRQMTDLQVLTWDESGSTHLAEIIDRSKIELDARAAAVILQDFLESK
jgi:RNase H-fold protein (predicted Holliday junction resolvase)